MNVFYRFLFIPFILLFTSINFSFGQNIILASGNELLGLDLSQGTCNTKTIRISCDPYFFSVALFKDTLYYIGSDFHIYMSVLGDSTICKPFEASTASNALTADKEGNLYWLDDVTGDLIKFNPHTEKQEDLGHIKYSSAGDLMFYKAKLYLASDNFNLVEINLQDPEKSTNYMSTQRHSFFGLINIPFGCNQNKVFGVESDTTLADVCNLIEVDMENRQIGQIFCSMPFAILDAASITENGTYEGVNINSINVHSDCIPGSQNNSIVVNATTASNDTINFSLNDSVKNITGVFQNLSTGDYHIYAETGGCSADTIVAIKDVIPPELELSILSPDCFDRSNGSIQLNTINNNLFTTSVNNSAFTNKYFYPDLTPGPYSVSLKDGSNCIWDTSVTVPAFTLHKPVIDFTTTNPQCWQSSFGKIKMKISGEENPYTVLIDGNMYQSGREVSGLLPADYPIKILNRTNCIVDSLSISLQQDNTGNCDTAYVPTAFTPNQDGKNDILRPVVGGFPETVLFNIYNRFGQIVFSTHKINEGWDGTYQGQPQSSGTYVWILQYTVNNTTKLFKGTTVSIR